MWGPTLISLLVRSSAPMILTHWDFCQLSSISLILSSICNLKQKQNMYEYEYCGKINNHRVKHCCSPNKFQFCSTNLHVIYNFWHGCNVMVPGKIRTTLLFHCSGWKWAVICDGKNATVLTANYVVKDIKSFGSIDVTISCQVCAHMHHLLMVLSRTNGRGSQHTWHALCAHTTMVRRQVVVVGDTDSFSFFVIAFIFQGLSGSACHIQTGWLSGAVAGSSPSNIPCTRDKK